MASSAAGSAVAEVVPSAPLGPAGGAQAVQEHHEGEGVGRATCSGCAPTPRRGEYAETVAPTLEEGGCPMSTRYCSTCGTLLTESAVICGECGARYQE
ncbi:hypothetical protein KW815_22495, partial [Enterobacter quasiroggenkampii]|nr:hypothetical protein [Enterobacter quasiroggenkampii]